jgi:hypothetical protein
VKPFVVEIDCGTGNPVQFTLDEGRIRSAGIKVQYAVLSEEGNPDEHTRLWRGAEQIARNVIARSREGTVTIYDGPDTWIIPEQSVRWVRLHDPNQLPDEEASEKRPIGFRIEPESGDITTR